MNNFLLTLQNLKTDSNSVKILKRHGRKDPNTNSLIEDMTKEVESTNKNLLKTYQNKSKTLENNITLSPQVTYTQEQIEELTQQLQNKVELKNSVSVFEKANETRVKSRTPLDTKNSVNESENRQNKSKIVIPDWCKTRPYMNDELIPTPSNYLTAFQNNFNSLHLPANNENIGTGSLPNHNHAKLGNFPLETQEQELISDLLNMFIGSAGTWIKIRYDENDTRKRIFNIDDSTEPGLKIATQKLLPLASNYLKVSNFINFYAWLPEAGQTLNALGAGMRRVMNDYSMTVSKIYKSHLASINEGNRNRRMTLQRLHATVTGPNGMFRKMQLLANIATSLETGKQQGAQVLTWLHERANKTGDELVANGIGFENFGF